MDTERTGDEDPLLRRFGYFVHDRKAVLPKEMSVTLPDGNSDDCGARVIEIDMDGLKEMYSATA